MNLNQLPVIVFARMSSTRLRGKALAPLGSETVLGYVVAAVGQVTLSTGLMVATSSDREDDAIAAWCHEAGVGCVRGPLNDVAARALLAAKTNGAECFVRVSGDSPLMDPVLIDHAIAMYQGNSCDVVTNVAPRSFPRGQSVEVIRTSALERAYKAGMDDAEREHVTVSMYAHPEAFSVINFSARDVTYPQAIDDYRQSSLAVDERADLEVCRRVIEVLDPEPPWRAGWRRTAALASLIRDGRE